LAIVTIKIPQLGEGLQEALLVEFLKQPGDTVDRDEPLFTMETDKAMSDVESPYAGKLVEWLVEVDSVLEIGTDIAVLDTIVEEHIAAGPAFDHGITLSSNADDSDDFDDRSGTMKVKRSPGALVAPRTRKFLIDQNILDLAKDIPAAGRKLTIADVEAFLKQNRAESAKQAEPEKPVDAFELVPVAKTQIKLNYRLTKAAQSCVPVTLVADWPWAKIESTRAAVRESGGPTSFAMLCWCIAQAVARHDSFRSSLTSDGKSYRVFKHVNLGIAVGIGNDELVAAVIKNADQLSSTEFFAAYRRQVDLAKQGTDQADESTTVMVSNIGNMGMRIGIPAIVAPAVATLAIGTPVSHPVPDGNSFRFERMISATMAFDHRVANGVGAANFMNEVKQQIDQFEL
jgi:pyruvate dehydrogenase E2 component (dihydrolipoamide acetyltransferase)